jgi:hypothetical protein
VIPDLSERRRSASRVARWLVSKERAPEAVELLCAWASQGPNDALGQELLADALRLAPTAKTAKQAFERMEGIASPQPELDTAVARFGTAELERLERELAAPTFRQAQIGFNNNIKAKGQLFHIQTEDSGLNAPHIVTHLFADGGRIIKSHKRDYASAVKQTTDPGAYVRKLMKAQHLEMVIALRDGRFDEILAGKTLGGLEVLTSYPDVDPSEPGRGRRAAGETAPGSAPSATGDTAQAAPDVMAAPPSVAVPSIAMPSTAMPSTALPSTAGAPPSTAVPASRAAPRSVARVSKPSLFTLHVVRSLSGGPGRYAVAKNESLIGSEGQIALEGERFCQPQHAALRFADGRLWITPLPGPNGIYVRIHRPTLLQFGEEFLVGDQLLRVSENPANDDAPDPAPTYFYSSPRWPSAFRVTQQLEGGADGTCCVARDSSLQIGSVMGDLILGEDPLVDPQHCVLEEQAGALLLTDLHSRTGVFVRVRDTEELVNGDEIVIGRTHLVIAIEAR